MVGTSTDGKGSKPLKTGLTPEQEKNVKDYLNIVWHDIAHDMFEANGGKDMKQADVIDVVLDQAYGAQYPAGRRVTPQAIEDVKAFFKLDMKLQEKFCRTYVFKDKRYC